MTFTDIVTEVMARLNLTSTEAETRIGRNVNTRYKRITSAIGLQTSRRTVVQANATLGDSLLTFAGLEKVIGVSDRSTGSVRMLREVTVEQIRALPVRTDDAPHHYANNRMSAGSVEILLDCTPQTAFTLYCDGHETAGTLSGTQEPAFSESYHDVLVEGAIADELRKQEKLTLALDQENQYERRLSDLRMWIAKSAYQDIHAGKRHTPTGSTGSGSSGGGSTGSTSYTQTGLITFDRSSAGAGSDPFAVVTGSGKVDNLDADLLDGEDGSAYHNAANLTGTVPNAAFPAVLPAVSGAALTALPNPLPASSGVNLTALNASNLGSGTVPDARFPATLPAASGANLTALNATQLTSGTVPQARLGAAQDISVCNGRLTLTTAVPVTSTDVTGATTIYFTPYKGNRLALYSGSVWTMYAFTELSLALGTLTSGKNYDVFVYDNSGTPTLELLAWTDDTTRATALTTQDGILSKSGATTRRYLGTIRTTATTTTEDSLVKRFVWNYYNRVRRSLSHVASDGSWTYTTAAYHQANANTANQLDVVIGVAEVSLEVLVQSSGTNSAGPVSATVAIGEDSTSAFATGCAVVPGAFISGENVGTSARLGKMPAIGRHFYAWLEYSAASGTTTWNGTNAAFVNSGMTGSIEG